MCKLFGSILLLKFSLWITLTEIIRADIHRDVTRRCGTSLAKDSVFGMIIVDINIDDRSLVNNSCILYITPKVLNTDKTNKVLFYFTDFDVGDDCNRGGLTMYDTYHTHLVPYSRSEMCGRNTSLASEFTIFIVRHGTLVLNYTRNVGKADDYNHKIYLELKYNSFYKYTTKPDCQSKFFHRCIYPSRCIHKDSWQCKENAVMNGCGYTPQYTCRDIGEPTAATSIKAIVICVVVAGVGFVIWKACPHLMKKACISLQDQCSQRNQDSFANENDRANGNLQQTELARDEDAVTSLSISRESSDETQRSDSPTSSTRLSIDYESDFHENTLPSDPPPSYATVEVPSYEHYMANRNLYKIPENIT